MVMPNLIHPVPVTLQILDRAGTVMDEDLREAVQNEARGASIVCPGQVLWTADQRLNLKPEGVKEDSDGYALFRYIDLQALSITLKRDDRIIRVGTVDVDVYIVKLQPMGHYPSASGPTLLKAFFKDKQPGRNTRGA
jgi:hypothetical protein